MSCSITTDFKHEYAVLAGRRFVMLSPAERDIWFGWITQGPDMSGFDESLRNGMGREPTPEDRERRINDWQFEKLHLIRDHLDAKWRDFYARMRDVHGEPELADLNMRVGPFQWGDESPMKLEAVAALSFEKAVEAVSCWKPDKSDWMGPNVEGLSSTFGRYVAARPEECSSQAQKLVGRPAIFVRKFIGQMGDAVVAGHDVDLVAVLELCRWVVDRPVEERTTINQPNETLIDKNWQWTADDILRFIEVVCKAESGESPRYALEKYREPIRELIKRLYKDQPTSCIVRDPSKEDPRVHDYLMLGINAPRGKAIEAAFEYARWVATQIEQGERKAGICAGRH